MRRTTAVLSLLPFLLVAAASSATAQDTGAAGDETFVPPIAGSWEPVQSLGQPPDLKPFFRLGYGLDGGSTTDAAGAGAAIGVFHDLFNPVYGALGLQLEAYAGQQGDDFDGGVQAHLASPATFVHAGVDWNWTKGEVGPAFGLTFPLQRGGWPVKGSQFRVDWIPGRDQNVVLGFAFTLRQPLVGRTRSHTVDVVLPDRPRTRTAPPPSGAAAHAVAGLLESMEWLAGMNRFFWLGRDTDINPEKSVAETRAALADFRTALETRDSLLPGVPAYEREVTLYHEFVDRAFGFALGHGEATAASAGRMAADVARRAILDEVVFPYNRLIGRYKQPDRLDGLAARARARVIAWLELEGVGEARRAEVLGVLDAWLAGFEHVRERMSDIGDDSRMQWIPLALVLRPGEHQSRAQIDALVERALGRGFLRGNAVKEINAARFQAELLRTIHEVEEYHVLWIHDYRGRNVLGEPDRVGFSQTVDGYLRALLAKVRAYDEVGRLPIYLLLLDQLNYEGTEGRLWLDLLEDPIGHEVELGRGEEAEAMERAIHAVQDSLRDAVASSVRLQAEAEAFGDDWIDEVIKVHVNVTNPADLTYRSRRLLRRGPPIGADNLMRDHRKIVIRDVTESDPARGEVILAGVGIGEHFASPTWDDRALIVQGPAALEAQAKAREVLERHGLVEEALPAPLRRRSRAGDYDARVRALEEGGATAEVLQVHNRTGWGEKEATFVQMLLYDLAPAGTVFYIPNSLWTSYESMAQLVGAALRGARVYVVAPSLANAPSPAFGPMSTSRELMTRVVLVQAEFGEVIARAGGDLRAGLYARDAPLDDLSTILSDLDEALDRDPFLTEIFPFREEARQVIRRLRDEALPAPGFPGFEDAVERIPQLHRKTQFIASASVLEAIGSSSRMQELLAEALTSTVLNGSTAERVGEEDADAPDGPSAELRELYEELAGEGAFEADPALYYLAGSVNKNVRSMALDGEVLAAVAGPWALQAYADFLVLSGGVVWVTSPEEVSSLIPPYSWIKRRIARWLYPVL
ncbi:MAG: hypothetical protein RQ745_07945 [Longimicrobiales bacterium]|nr:hypothetical protein [Longimicrobiales bacterium]